MRNNTNRAFSAVEHRGARVYLETLPITAAVIAENNGVEVVFDLDGNLGCTNGQQIHLIQPPELKANAPLEKIDRLVTLYRGVLNHEVGHIRKSAIDELNRKVKATSNPALVHALVNAIEDPRMENAHGADYRGADADMRRMSKMLVAEGLDAAIKEDAPPRQIVSAMCNHSLRAHLRNQEEYLPIAEEDERVARKVLGDSLTTRVLAALATAIPTLQSPLDVVKVAKQIATVIKEEQEKSEQEQQEQSQSQSQQQRGQQGVGSGEQQGQPSPQGDDGQAPASPEQNQAMKDLLNDDQAPSIKDASQIANEAIAGAIQQMVDDGTAEEGQPIDQIPTQQGSGAGDAAATPQGRDTMDAGKVRGESAKVRTRLAQLLQTQTMEETWIDRRGHRIDRHCLHRPRLGDGRIFQRNTESESPDTAMFLLVDNSGSMGSEPMRIAREAALAMAMAADMLPGISIAVGTFPTFELVQPFGMSVRRRIPYYGIRATGGTPTAEGVLWASKHLAARPESRRMIVVVTDGQPNDEDRARSAIRGARAHGVEVHGLGIGNCAQRIPALFGKGEAIQDVHELSGALFKLLESTARLTRAA